LRSGFWLYRTLIFEKPASFVVGPGTATRAPVFSSVEPVFIIGGAPAVAESAQAGVGMPEGRKKNRRPKKGKSKDIAEN
jgi:hypothetical protein